MKSVPRARARAERLSQEPAGEVTPDAVRSSPFLRSLEIFLAVVENGGFTAAARKVGISQPSVTQRVQGLEESLGVELFNRTQGIVEPTAAGRTLIVYAERLLQLRDEMLLDLRAATQIRRGTLRIAASTTPGNYLMPTVLQRFRAHHRDVRVVMEVGDTLQVVDRVRDGRVEVGVAGYATFGAEFECEPFIDDEIVVITPPSHPLLTCERAPIGKLVKYPWVVRERGSGTRKVIDMLMADAHPQLEIALEVDSTEAIKLAVRAGAGIALVSRRAVENEVALKLLHSRPLDGPGLQRQFFLLRKAGRTLSPQADALWSYLLGMKRFDAVVPQD